MHTMSDAQLLLALDYAGDLLSGAHPNTHDVVREGRRRLAALQSENKALREALVRVVRAFESDSERVPDMDVRTCWETNGAAIEQARTALALAGEVPRV